MSDAPDRIIATAYWRGNQYHTNFYCKQSSEKEFDRVEYVPADALEAAQARIQELEEGLRQQIFFHAMTLSLRREYMDPEEVKDVEFRRDAARAALDSTGKGGK